MHNLKVYVINLKKDIIKKKHMQQLCYEYNLNAEFIKAVYGKELSKDEVYKMYDSAKSQKLLKRELTLAEIGCELSHLSIYKKMIAENIETALVLEDDIDFNEKLISILSHIDKFPQEWEVVLVGHHSKYSRKISTTGSVWNCMKLMDDFKLEYPVEKGYGTYGYIINKKGAQKLLNHLEKFSYPIDYYTGNNHYVNVLLLNKPLIKISEKYENSTNMSERNNIKKNFKGICMDILEKLKIVHLILFISKFKKVKPYQVNNIDG